MRMTGETGRGGGADSSNLPSAHNVRVFIEEACISEAVDMAIHNVYWRVFREQNARKSTDGLFVSRAGSVVTYRSSGRLFYC